jgi:magnesium chelatase family protein
LQAVERYRQRLSGPVLDRIDVKLHVDAVEIKSLTQKDKTQNETSVQIRQRVIKARNRQLKRYQQTPYLTNSELLSKDIRQFCHLIPDASQLLTQAASRLGLSARAYFKVIKVAQTITDLAGKDEINAQAISEALQYR